MRNEKDTKYDIIADIHGQREKLEALLDHLGYNAGKDHPEGRKVLFLGDFIDRGPDVRGVLEIVKGMVDSGNALAVMGNHEFNAICYETPLPDGGWLRPHGEKNDGQLAETLESFGGRTAEWKGWIEWFKTLPMWLDLGDLGDLRAVHACWDERSINEIGDRDLRDPDFLIAAGTKRTPEYEAVEILLEGPEMPLPEGVSFDDRNGITRYNARVRWWDLEGAVGSTVSEVSMPRRSVDCDAPVSGEELSGIPDYPADAPPVFFGHYWMPPESPKEPLAPNVICLDFSAGKAGPLVAYRWDGGGRIEAARFTVAPGASGCEVTAE